MLAKAGKVGSGSGSLEAWEIGNIREIHSLPARVMGFLNRYY